MAYDFDYFYYTMNYPARYNRVSTKQISNCKKIDSFSHKLH